MLTSFSILSNHLTQGMLVEADYLATTLDQICMHCEHGGPAARSASLPATAPLTPLARMILGLMHQEKKGPKRAHVEAKATTAESASTSDDNDADTQACAMFSAHVQGVQRRLSTLANCVLTAFSDRYDRLCGIEADAADRHLHVTFLPHASSSDALHPTGGGAIDAASPNVGNSIAPSSIFCQVVARNGAAVVARWKSRQRLAELQSERYYCKQPLAWTSQEAEAYYFGVRSVLEEDDDAALPAEAARNVFDEIRGMLQSNRVVPRKVENPQEHAMLSSHRPVVRGCDEFVGVEEQAEPLLGDVCVRKLKRTQELNGAGKKGPQKRARASESAPTTVPPLVIESDGCGLSGVYYITVTGVAILGGPLGPNRCETNSKMAIVTCSSPMANDDDDGFSKASAPQRQPEAEEGQEQQDMQQPNQRRSGDAMTVSLPFNGFLRTVLRM